MTIDPRAQELFFEIRNLKAREAQPDVLRPLCLEAARLHEAVAFDNLAPRDVGTWPDLYAAITYYAEAGELADAARLIAAGREQAPKDAAPLKLAEFGYLERWIANELPNPNNDTSK